MYSKRNSQPEIPTFHYGIGTELGTAKGGSVWLEITIPFVGTGRPQTIWFEESDSEDGRGSLLDSIQVINIGSAP